MFPAPVFETGVPPLAIHLLHRSDEIAHEPELFPGALPRSTAGGTSASARGQRGTVSGHIPASSQL